jgi:thioredoxin reductase
MTLLDCAIVGGGPAGSNAALVLGRARKNVVLFDENKPANAVVQHSWGFVTRNGIAPQEFKNIAHQELRAYPSVAIQHTQVTSVRPYQDSSFELETASNETFYAKTVLLATGVKISLPTIDGVQDYFGTSLFVCPYCDGWELRDKPLVILSDGQSPFHLATLVQNWSRNLLVCTNGHSVLTAEQRETLLRNEIQVAEDKIKTLVGKNGKLERIVFATNEERACEGGFVVGQAVQASSLSAMLRCDMNAQGGISVDDLGRTTVKGIYAAGDASLGRASQLILAASQGNMAAAGITMDLVQRELR